MRNAPGIVRRPRVVSHQRAQDGGDQGRARAVAHHVRDEDAGAVFIQLDEIEEIPADGGGGLIEMGELEAQRIVDGRWRALPDSARAAARSGTRGPFRDPRG